MMSHSSTQVNQNNLALFILVLHFDLMTRRGLMWVTSDVMVGSIMFLLWSFIPTKKGLWGASVSFDQELWYRTMAPST
jgi:hypothetical protein